MPAILDDADVVLRDPYAEPPEDVLFEIVDGVYREKPMGVLEIWLTSRLAEVFFHYCRASKLGQIFQEMMFRMSSTGNGRKPDIAFVSAKRWPRNRAAPSRNAWNIVPELAIEIISKSEKTSESFDKVDEYFASGVSRVWQILPEAQKILVYHSPTTIQVYVPGQILRDEEILPGFELDLNDLFLTETSE